MIVLLDAGACTTGIAGSHALAPMTRARAKAKAKALVLAIVTSQILAGCALPLMPPERVRYVPEDARVLAASPADEDYAHKHCEDEALTYAGPRPYDPVGVQRYNDGKSLLFDSCMHRYGFRRPAAAR